MPDSHQEGVPVDKETLSALLPPAQHFMHQKHLGAGSPVVMTKYTLQQGQEGAENASPIPVVVTQYRMPEEGVHQESAGGVGRDNIPVMMTQFAFPKGVPGVGGQTGKETSENGGDSRTSSSNGDTNRGSDSKAKDEGDTGKPLLQEQVAPSDHYTPGTVSSSTSPEVTTEHLTTVYHVSSSTLHAHEQNQEGKGKHKDEISTSTEDASYLESSETTLDDYTDFRLLKPMTTLEMMVRMTKPEQRMGIAKGI